MDRKVKTISAISFSIAVLGGCTTTNMPYTLGTSQNAPYGSTHTHNGVVHTHTLPASGLNHSHENMATTCTPCGTQKRVVTNRSDKGGVSHSHNGKTHCHRLPSTGVNHVHNSRPATVVRRAPVKKAPVVVATQPAPRPRYTGPIKGNGNTAYKNYTRNYTGFTYDYGSKRKGVVTHTHNGKEHAHLLPSAGLNHNHTGNTSLSNTYNSYASGGGSSYSGGGRTYIVKRSEGVMAIARNELGDVHRWREIVNLNNLRGPKYSLTPGQRIKLP